MPDYNFTITIPANTPRDDPQKVELELTRGIIAGGQIYFPAGCHGLAHVVICDGNGQLYPSNADETFHGEDGAIPLVGRYLLDSAPYKLYAKAWNLDDTYDHTVQLTINVLSPEEVNLSLGLNELIDLFKMFLNRIGVRV
ncbi:MAG: hypothetical protein DRJ03_09350 [Chloroflexi bacterium]|nr:MAG: hypothetical protein DRJ03_09350 [Chloroflexota bacterium]